ncbi:hypothetical protein NMY22_g1369 [Coprinellus aureogranulatus]|nr:hypothetical protein NMY22_g1369 [Coprinellus aureogranulatus]
MRKLCYMQEAQNIIARTGWLDDAKGSLDAPSESTSQEEACPTHEDNDSPALPATQQADADEDTDSSECSSNDDDTPPSVSKEQPKKPSKKSPKNTQVNFQPDFFVSTGLSPTHWKAVIKEKRAEVMSKKQKNTTKGKSKSKPQSNPIPEENKGEVKLLDASYLRYDFKAKQKRSMDVINSISKKFCLNKEQDRAFRIVANHAASAAPEQLKMYLGGMGGTGKSQVIKALIAMFKKRGESHRFIVVAPTGTAAALLNGSTYHSMFGINMRSKDEDNVPRRNETVSINDARERMRGVDYVFIDEISMVSCHELYGISARLAQIANVYDMPFGGYSMIFAGDFAQLPPTSGVSLYGLTDRYNSGASMKLKSQESAIGKHLWQQITVVVILVQNMRQNSQSPEDAQFRSTLENMRYGACTDDNLVFLRSRVANRTSSETSLALPQFQNVSVITSWNAYKDRYNQLGAERFAKRFGKELKEFCSEDILGVLEDTVSKKGTRVKRASMARQSYPGPCNGYCGIWNLTAVNTYQEN